MNIYKKNMTKEERKTLTKEERKLRSKYFLNQLDGYIKQLDQLIK